MTPDDHATINNALHAAATWIERRGADPASVAVVNFQEPVGLGLWQPGDANVGMLSGIDDAGAEMLEAVAPAIGQAMGQLDAAALDAVAAATAQGAQVQALLQPAAGELSLRLLPPHGQVVPLVTLVPLPN